MQQSRDAATRRPARRIAMTEQDWVVVVPVLLLLTPLVLELVDRFGLRKIPVEPVRRRA